MSKNNTFSKPRADFLSSLCTELSLIINAGIPISEGFDMLADDNACSPHSDLLRELATLTAVGTPVFSAMKATGAFPEHMINMVEIGEYTGKLDEVFESLSIYYERQQRINNSIRNAVVYPAILIALMITVITVVITQVLPIFNDVFQQLGATMSAPARILMNLGMSLSKYAVWGILILIAVIVAVATIGRRLIKRSKLGMKISAANFASVMAMTTASGIDTDKSLEMAKRLIANPTIVKRIDSCIEIVKNGGSFYQAISTANIFPSVYSRMILVGFKTGAVDTVMSEIARRCEESVNDEIDSVIGKIEPSLVIIMSVLVGLILMSVMIPLMSIMTYI